MPDCPALIRSECPGLRLRRVTVCRQQDVDRRCPCARIAGADLEGAREVGWLECTVGAIGKVRRRVSWTLVDLDGVAGIHFVVGWQRIQA